MAELSISRAVTRLAEVDASRTVVTAPDGVLTAGELDARSNALARECRRLGVVRDDLVTLCLPSSAELVVACCAVWKVGATPQPLDPSCSQEELAAVVDVARPRLLVGRHVDGSPWLPSVPAGWRPAPRTSRAPVEDVWSRSWKAPTSSGSTGRPKVVVAAAPALVDPARPAAPFLPLDGVQLVVAPLTGSAAFTYAFRGLLTGHSLVLLGVPASGRPDARAVLAALVEHRVTWVQLSPAVLGDLVRLPEDERAAADLCALQSVVHLGAPCDPWVKRAAIAWLGGRRVVEVYAGAESQGLTVIEGDEWLAHPGSVGRGAGGTELRVRSPDGRDLPPGEVGEVWMRRPGGPAYAYLGAASRRDADGWDTLGDLGHLEANGYLHLLDRVGATVERGGRTVALAEVEHLLERHPAVRSAAARPAPELGDGALSALVDTGGDPVPLEELRAWCLRTGGAALVPTVLVAAGGPVRSATGKPRRRATG